MSLARGRWLFAAALLVAALSSRRDYAMDPLSIGSALDLKYDFIAAHWIASGRPMTALDRDTADAVGDRLGTPAVPPWPGSPAHTHPPPATAVVRPMLPLGFAGASWAFFALSLAATFGLAQLLLGLWRESDRLPPPRAAAPYAVALAVWPPSVFNFGYGQWSMFAATLVAAGWWSVERGTHWRSSGWLAGAVAIKSTPALLGGYLVLFAPRLAARMAIAVAIIVLVTLPFTGGVDAWVAYLRGGPAAVATFESYIHNTASIRGVFVRLFVTSRFSIAVVDRPALGHALAGAASIALVLLAFVISFRRTRSTVGRQVDPAVFAMWACLIPLLNPLSWSHNVLLLLLPAVLLARGDVGLRRRIAVAAAVVLITIPRSTLLQWAGFYVPLPASRAWLLGTHAFAGLILFASAAAACVLRPERPVSPAPPATAPGGS